MIRITAGELKARNTKIGLSSGAVTVCCSLCDELTGLKTQFVGNDQQPFRKPSGLSVEIKSSEFEARRDRLQRTVRPTRGFSVLLPYRDYVSPSVAIGIYSSV
jgi:hypothetical protein